MLPSIIKHEFNCNPEIFLSANSFEIRDLSSLELWVTLEEILFAIIVKVCESASFLLSFKKVALNVQIKGLPLDRLSKMDLLLSFG